MTIDILLSQNRPANCCIATLRNSVHRRRPSPIRSTFGTVLFSAVGAAPQLLVSARISSASGTFSALLTAAAAGNADGSATAGCCRPPPRWLSHIRLASRRPQRQARQPGARAFFYLKDPRWGCWHWDGHPRRQLAPPAAKRVRMTEQGGAGHVGIGMVAAAPPGAERAHLGPEVEQRGKDRERDREARVLAACLCALRRAVGLSCLTLIIGIIVFNHNYRRAVGLS